MNHASILRSYYDKKRKEGRRFSMRAMAKKLGISVSLLSLILNGKRNLPIRLIDAISTLLDIDQVDRDRLVHLMLVQKGNEPARARDLMKRAYSSPGGQSGQLKWETLGKSDIEHLTDWRDIAIFLCCGLSDFDGSPEFVARKLFLDLGEVNRKMQQLKAAGFLREINGKLQRGKKVLQLRSGKDLSVIRRYHKSHLENAAWALEHNTAEQDVQNRLITGMTLTASLRSVPLIKQRIQDLLLEIAQMSSEDAPEEVFQFAVQLFPLSRPGQK